MIKESRLLIIVALVLGTVYACFFTGWFQPQTIQIAHASRNLRSRLQPANAPPSLTFSLNQQFKLTEIKAVPLAEWQTNHSVLPVWHLVSDSRSEPVKIFAYGQSIRGMKPAIAGSGAQTLQTNVAYRLFVTAGKAKGQHDFEIGGRLPEVK